MKTIRVQSVWGGYPVFVGEGLLAKAGGLLKSLALRPCKMMVVTQKPIARPHLSYVLKSLTREGFSCHTHFLPDSEKAKSREGLFSLYHALLRRGFERRDMIFALGGGVVGDLSGFAAATYLRGIGFVNAGTTLLAQVDSSIGGKTGINLKEGKNLVGAFYPPRLVISDTGALSTLPRREFQASVAEIIKYGIIRNSSLFGLLERDTEKILARNRHLLIRIIAASAGIKARIVSRDEHENKGERMILNYGHTFAHAFEQALNFRKLLHGEAVAVGMVCAADLANRLGLFASKAKERQNRLIRNFHLPVSIKRYSLRAVDIAAAMMRDKKKKGGELRFVLPVRIGHVEIRENVPTDLIRKVIQDAGGK